MKFGFSCIVMSVCVLASLSFGGELPALPANAFDVSRAKKPGPGDWLEYRIAFPVDPLENSLSPNPAATPLREGGAVLDIDGDTTVFIPEPSFEPSVAWRAVPLRLEIQDVLGGGCAAAVRFANETVRVSIPFFVEPPKVEFRYDPVPGDAVPERATVDLNGAPLPVEVIRRTGDGGGFVRYFSPEVPFGVVRFATENVDMILVGSGNGAPPPFPLDTSDMTIHPLPGLLHPKPY